MVQLVEESISEMDRYVLAVQRPVRMHEKSRAGDRGVEEESLLLFPDLCQIQPQVVLNEVDEVRSGTSRHQPMNWSDSIRASDNRHTWGCFHCVKLRSVEWTYEREHGFSCIFNLILKWRAVEFYSFSSTEFHYFCTWQQTAVSSSKCSNYTLSPSRI